MYYFAWFYFVFNVTKRSKDNPQNNSFLHAHNVPQFENVNSNTEWSLTQPFIPHLKIKNLRYVHINVSRKGITCNKGFSNKLGDSFLLISSQSAGKDTLTEVAGSPFTFHRENPCQFRQVPCIPNSIKSAIKWEQYYVTRGLLKSSELFICFLWH